MGIVCREGMAKRTAQPRDPAQSDNWDPLGPGVAELGAISRGKREGQFLGNDEMMMTLKGGVIPAAALAAVGVVVVALILWLA